MSLGGERRTGLILAGGGARAAYQVGVLQVVADTLAVRSENPFPILVATSAGALNAAVLGCGALDFGRAVDRLAAVWSSLETAMIYRSDWAGASRQAARFGLQTLFGAWRQEPLALLDNAPLRALLSRELDFSGITAALRQRALRAVAVTAFGYASGQAMTFYQSHGALDPWFRHRRVGVPARLAVDHLLASTAIPLFFPPVKVGREFLGDGSVRQTAPISPALHLGAERILVIGLGAPGGHEHGLQGRPPTVAQIGGHLLNSTFVDALDSDTETLRRLNLLSSALPAGDPVSGRFCRPVDMLVISPSQPLADIATRHRKRLPPALRQLLRGVGVNRPSGSALLSYLLFEAAYCQELMALGRTDALARLPELQTFLARA
ncbi:NTE family protein [Pseudomonas oryzihabitans]|uniref:Patatin-like phospholipase family protein n=1 Tax=Pseudomonas flavocrustae TaxID=2991719 RepID=A0ABT6IDR4_9PSED|nr:patatin-like phospholipase family protein [Pseudomonas sp. CBMAI 2609]MDH4762639.1 patatin-like phospholipase family protein [Pseudomonas sp. CBMAI 2609]